MKTFFKSIALSKDDPFHADIKNDVKLIQILFLIFTLQENLHPESSK